MLNAMNRSEDASVIHRALNSGTVASTGLTLPPVSLVCPSVPQVSVLPAAAASGLVGVIASKQDSNATC